MNYCTLDSMNAVYSIYNIRTFKNIHIINKHVTVFGAYGMSSLNDYELVYFLMQFSPPNSSKKFLTSICFARAISSAK